MPNQSRNPLIAPQVSRRGVPKPRSLRRNVGVCLAFLAVMATANLASGNQEAAPNSDSPALLLTEAPRSLSFEANLGQWNPEALYRVHADGYDAYLTASKLVMVFTPANSDSELPVNHTAVIMHYDGATTPALRTGRQLDEVSNYLVGDDAAKWITGVPHYESVTLGNVYPGIDAVYRSGADGALEYDFVVKPGAKPDDIQLRFDGLQGLAIDKEGRLELATGMNAAFHAPPSTYQVTDGAMQSVSSRFVQVNSTTVGFAVDNYDASRDLVIDPLVYSTFLGGTGTDNLVATATDGTYQYVAGYSSSANYPTTSGAYQTTNADTTGVITKINAAGTGLVYSTYLGGTGADSLQGMAVDGSGNVYVTGYTQSTNYPVTTGAYDTTSGGSYDAIFSKLAPNGASLLYSTYLGGTNSDVGYGVVLDSSGAAYIAGATLSTNFPTTAGVYDTTGSTNYVGFVTKFSPTGSLAYSTFLGSHANGQDFLLGIAIDGSGNAYVTGYTTSFSYPTTMGAYDTTYNGGEDAVIAKLNPTASSLLYATYLGGGFNDRGQGIVVDEQGRAIVAGETYSNNFPVTAGALQAARSGPSDGLVTRLTATGDALDYSSYLGGSDQDAARAIARNEAGIFVVGETRSTNFPLSADAYQSTNHGSIDAFVTQFKPTMALGYSSFLGGVNYDYARAVALSPSAAYVAGYTTEGFPTTVGAYQTNWAGGDDGFAARLSTLDEVLPMVSGNPVMTGWITAGTTITGVTWQDQNSGLAANAQYSIGTTSGATNVLPWTAMPVQPTNGQTTPWNPSWPPTGLVAGRNYVNTRIADVAGNLLTTPGAYVVDYDATMATVSGAPSNLGWHNTMTLSGVTWSDSLSGLAASVQYSVGTTSGAINVQNWTIAPVQPTPGQTTAWTPSWTPSTLAQGTNHVNMRVWDRAGNLVTTNGAYRIDYDTAPPTATAPITTPWQLPSTPVSGVSFQDVLSGLANTAQYSIGTTSGASDIRGWNLMPVQPTVGQTTPWNPSWTPVGVQSGINHVNIRILDQAGNVLTSNGAYVVRVDVDSPTATGNPFTLPWLNANPTLVGVTWQDSQSGLASAQYSIGSTSGAINVVNWTAMPVQPTNGQTTPWNPTWVPAGMLPQGLSYVNVRVTDVVGSQTTTNGAYVIRYDTGAATSSGNPQAWTWRNTIPTLTGVSWTDSLSGLAASVRYSVGSSSGGTQTLDWRPLPVQPSAGQTSPWNPSWPPDTLGQGLNYVNIQVTDVAGNQVITPGAYTVQYDVTPVSSTGNPQAFSWRNTAATLNGVTYQDVHSGLQATVKYSVGTAPGAANVVPLGNLPVQPTSGQTTPWTPSWSPSSLAQGMNYVNVLVTDVAGNVRPIDGAYTVQYDTALPTIGGATVTTPWQHADVPITGIAWQDPRSGLLATVQYSVGTTSGATDVYPWTPMPVQPAAGQTSAWMPSFVPATLIPGTNYVNTRVWDQAGNLLSTNGAWIVNADSVTPTISGSPLVKPWSTAASPLSGVTWQDPQSGLAASMQYSLGTTSGATDILNWTAMPVQPTSGQTTPWTPTWTPAGSLPQGLSYVNVRASDVVDNVLSTNGAYIFQLDDASESISGLIAKSNAGGSILPSTIQADNTPRYEWSVPPSTSPILGYSTSLDGSTPDGSVLQTNNFLDRAGQPLPNGVIVFQVRAKDTAGNLGSVASITLQIDGIPPVLVSLSSSTHPVAASFYNNTNARVTWAYSDDLGVAGYYYDLTEASCPDSLASTGTFLPAANTSLNFTGLAAFGAYRFCIQAADTTGNLSPVSTLALNVDAVNPTITSVLPARASHSTSNRDHVRITYNDTDGGLDPSQLTHVDIHALRFVVDDVDVVAVWQPLCAQLPMDLCRFDVTTSYVDYYPLVPFAQGNHTLHVEVQDEAIAANHAVVDSFFIVDAANGATGDFDGDQVTDSQESLICALENSQWYADGSCTLDGTDWLPPHPAGLLKDAAVLVATVQGVLNP